LNVPFDVTVDGAGNVYIADSSNHAIKMWMRTSSTVATLVSMGLGSTPIGIAVDSVGNVYITDVGLDAIYKWTAVSNTVTTIVSGLSSRGVTVDGAGNVFIADSGNNTLKELPHAFVDSTAKMEPAISGNDTLPAALSTIASLTGAFAPTNDLSWLTIKGVTNGVVSFAFTANYYTTNRTGHITVLGQSIAVTQSGITQPATVQPNLTGCKIMGNGSLQFCFTNNQGASFTVWTSTNMLLPFTNWTALGPLTNDGSGQYQFSDPSVTNGGQRFYRVSSP